MSLRSWLRDAIVGPASRSRDPALPARRTRLRVEVLEGRAIMAAGALDPTFGAGGQVVTDIPAPARDQANALAVQTDGKVVAVGITDRDFALARYNPSGSLDAGFGTGGRVTTDFGAFEVAQGVAVQADGKIVVAGLTGTSFALARYNTDGSLDTDFGGDGVVTTAVGAGTSDRAHSVAVLTDGRIVVAGDSAGAAAVARYEADGSLDDTFGGDGTVTTAINGSSSGADYGAYCRLAVQPDDGKVVVTWDGSWTDAGGPADFVLLRYATDGSLDGGFGTEGKVVTDFGAVDFAKSVAVQAGGKIVVAGVSNGDFAVARYTASGALDPTFDGDGKAVIGFGAVYWCGARGVAVQADGKVVAAGVSYGTATESDELTVVRLTAAGALDDGFDGDGKAVTDFTARPGNDAGNAVAVQADGKVVVAGVSGRRFAVARYNADGTPDPTFGTPDPARPGSRTGRADVGFGPGANDFYVHGVVVQPNGRIVVVGNVSWNFALARFNADGSPDGGTAADGTPGDSFGTGGRVVTDMGASDSAWGVTVQSDGKIVVAGIKNTPLYSKWGSIPYGYAADFALARYTTTGALDTTFNKTGKVVTDLGSDKDYARCVAVQPDGKILVAGESNNNFALARYTGTGQLDSGFGSRGKVVTDFGGTDSLSTVAVQTIGGQVKIVAAGSSNGDFALAWYTASGTASGALDTSFSGDGKVTTDLGGEDAVRAVRVQADGRVAAAGTSGGDVALAWYNADGSPDTTADADGKVVSEFGSGSDAAAAVAFQVDGKVVAAGAASRPGTGSDFAVARYLPAAPPRIGTFTASASSVTAGESVTLTAGGVTAGVTGSTVRRVAFYRDVNGDGRLDPSELLGEGVLAADGSWRLTVSTAGWAAGAYTLYAQATDSNGFLSDPPALQLAVRSGS